jgi:hypothetical protein
MSASSPDADLPVRRRDEDSDWHDLLPRPCEICGCITSYAKDDPEIIWEPGMAWDESCSDRDCRCHTQPVIGTRRDA